MALRRRFLAFIILVVLAALALLSWACAPIGGAVAETSSDITLTIIDSSGAPISGIDVRLYYSGAARYSVSTDEDGKVVIDAAVLPYNVKYSVYVRLSDSVDDVKTELNLAPGESGSITLYTVKYYDNDSLLHTSYMVRGGALKLKSSSALHLSYPQGKLFSGWKKNGSGDLIADGSSVIVKDDTDYVAQWQNKGYNYVIASSASGYSLKEDGIIAPTNYFSNLSDLMTALETGRDNTKACTITLNITDISTPLTLRYGTYNINTSRGSVASAFVGGGIVVEEGATLNFSGKITRSDSSLSDDDYSIAVDGGELVLKSGAQVDSVLIVGKVGDTHRSTLTLDGYTGALELGYSYGSEKSYHQLKKSDEDYSSARTDILGYTLIENVETPSDYTLRWADKAECFGMAYDATEKRLYMEEKFSIEFLSNFVETEHTRLVGILPSTVYVLKGSGASLPALPDATYLRGHSFDGWRYDGDVLPSGSVFSPISDTELYAAFSPLSYAVTYDGIKHASPSTTAHTYMTDTLLDPLSTPGYTFVGYNLLDGTPLEKRGEKYVLGGENFVSDVALTAVWSLDAPTVTLSDYLAAYDGKTHLISPVVTHASPDPVTYLYNWSDGGNSDSYAVRRVNDSAEVTLILTAWDGELFSSAVTVTITARITPRPIKIKIKDVEQIVGRYPVSPDYEIVEGTLAAGDTLSALDIRWTREEGDDVGDYNMTATASNPDYSVEFIDGTYTIIPVDVASVIVVSVVASVAAVSLFAFILASILKRKRGPLK